MFANNCIGISSTVKNPHEVNLVGDFPPLGSMSSFLQSSNHFPSTNTNLLTMPSFNANPKTATTITSYHNGYPMVADQTKTISVNPSSGNFSQSTEHNGCVSKANGAKGSAIITEKGNVRNLPQSMLNNAFGMAALIVGLKATAATEIRGSPNTISSQVMEEMSWIWKKDTPNDQKYKSYSGPLTKSSEPESFSTEVCQDYQICPEYLVTQRLIYDTATTDMDYIRNMWALKMDKFSDGLLFYMFYTFTRDILQVVAANHLYNRGWRYHMVAKVWLQQMDNEVYARASGNPYLEEGIYQYFDYVNWKTAKFEMTLDASKLEGPPKVPPEYFVSTSSKT